MQAWWKAGLGLCALGTTLRQAKSKAGFYRVDHDYVLTAAKLAQHAETLTFGFVSSLNADVSFRLFYLKVNDNKYNFIVAITTLFPAFLGSGSLTRRNENHKTYLIAVIPRCLN
jgi:hypothetical protein